MTSVIQKFARLHHVAIFTALTVFGLAAYAIGVPFLDLMELKTIDLRFQSRGGIEPGGDIVLAVVDEKSIAREGKWLWPRSKFTELIEKLSSAGARIIAFDIGFLEPDSGRLLEVISKIQHHSRQTDPADRKLDAFLESLKIEANQDHRLARAIAESSSTIVLGYFFQMNPANAPQLKEAELRQHQQNIHHSKYNLERYSSTAARTVPLFQAVYPQSNIAELAEAAAYSGYFNMLPDRDGVVRWLPAVLQFRETLYAPLSLVSVGAYLQQPLAVYIDDYGVRQVRIGTMQIPTDEQGRILVNYRGEEKTFPHLPITDILSGTVPPDRLKDKIVMVGATAAGIYDLRVTPFGEVFPGLEIHANLIDSVLAQDFLHRPKWVAIFDLLAILVAGICMGLILPRVSVIPGLAAMLAIFLGYILFCQYLFTHHGLVLNIVYPLSVLLLVYLSITAQRYFAETKQKRFIKNAFSTYLAPSVVKQLIESPESLELGGEERDITAFFSDVQGFTSISESLGPTELVDLLNEFLTEMTDIILQNEGTVDKFEGDAIIAFFGAPNFLADHATRACTASTQMQQRLHEMRRMWEAGGKPSLKMRIGLNSGRAVVGNMGSASRMDYTMMGDMVNIAARLEGINKIYGTYTLIGESTFRNAGDQFACRQIDTIRVVGRHEPLTVYELLAPADAVADPLRQILDLYDRGLQAYRQRNWDLAIDCFRRATEIDSTDGPSGTMLSRCLAFKNDPPADNWDRSYDIRVK
ncbi:MAG: guanylate cyclase [Deltaproteobacteria bacterium SG8_13]|nr:MAG: guanylate cyclase [Deltaproteobacteria bacterium SG8_13]